MRHNIHIEHNFIRFPIQAHGIEREVHIFLNEKEIYRFMASLFMGQKAEDCDFYAELPVQHLKGQRIEVVIEASEDADGLRGNLVQADELLKREEGKYPYLHFAPVSGWLNDPCGLCWYKGEYHLFFQHNMFDLKWNNIGWGHAVSRDLLHWEQLEEALMPDEQGAVFTGSAIINSGEGRPGMSGCPEDALLLFYTCAGGRTEWSEGLQFTQKAACSTDGRSFVRMEETLIPHIVFENRDPKVYWNEAASSYYLVLFLDEHEYGIFVSEDMKDWELTQKLTIEESWECPDLRQIPVYGTDEKKWMFWTPDGYYLVGEFDGKKFTPGQEIRRIYGFDHEREVAYAAQSFWGTEGRVVQIPWLRTGEKERLYLGIMGLPRELALRKKDGEWILSASPVQEVYAQERRLWEMSAGDGPEEACAQEKCLWGTSSVGGCGQERICEESFGWKEDGAALLQMKNPDGHSFEVDFCGVRIDWMQEERQLQIGDMAPVSCEGLRDMTLIADKGILEIGCNQDSVLYYVEIELEFCKKVRIRGHVDAALGIIR